jgi:L-ascorbate metabolism protein UlaG (beta-lactamase superfamily)
MGLILFACSSKDKENFTEQGWAQAVESTSSQALYTPHRSENRFFAPWMVMGDKSFLDVLGWKLFSVTDYTREEKHFLPRVIPDTARRMTEAKGDYILWIGHNSFLVRINNTYWLTDPIFSKRALLPARVTPPAISIPELNRLVKAPNIIISHNHYDHLDRWSMEALPKTAKVFVPLGLETYVKEMNKPKTMEMDWWEKKDLGKGISLICLPAQHWSMRINQGRNKSLWASWLLITPKTTLYFGGDSGYFKGFREIGKKYPGIDYAFMATTAYHPRWFMHYQHMNLPEAVKGFEELGARFFIPTQWGTFHLGSEPAGYPGLDLNRHIQAKGLDPRRFKPMDIGGILPI